MNTLNLCSNNKNDLNNLTLTEYFQLYSFIGLKSYGEIPLIVFFFNIKLKSRIIPLLLLDFIDFIILANIF